MNITKDFLLSIGFYQLTHFNITNAMLYPLGRNRFISVGCVSTPNEMVWIQEHSEDNTEITDLVCLRNYDYDGYTTEDKLKDIIQSIKER